jgi:hypothetical protein
VQCQLNRTLINYVTLSVIRLRQLLLLNHEKEFESGIDGAEGTMRCRMFAFGEQPKSKHTTYKTRRKFKINNTEIFINSNRCAPDNSHLVDSPLRILCAS